MRLENTRELLRDLHFTVGQMRGALDVIRSDSPIDRERLEGLIVAWIARLEPAPSIPAPMEEARAESKFERYVLDRVHPDRHDEPTPTSPLIALAEELEARAEKPPHELTDDAQRTWVTIMREVAQMLRDYASRLPNPRHRTVLSR